MNFNLNQQLSNLGAWAIYNKPMLLGMTSKIATVAGTVAAGVGTVKAMKAAESAKKRVSDAKECLENDILTEEECKKEVKKAVVNAAVAVAKAYIPAVGFVTLSLYSHSKQEQEYNQRYAAMAAAYMTLAASYNKVAGKLDKEDLLDAELGRRDDVDEATGEHIKIAESENNEYTVYFEPHYGNGRGSVLWDEDIGINEVLINSSINMAQQELFTDLYATTGDFLKSIGMYKVAEMEEKGLGWVDGDTVQIDVHKVLRRKEPGFEYGKAADPDSQVYECLAIQFRNAHPIYGQLKQKGVMR